MNAINGLLSSSILTCQYPDFRSSEENHWEPCKLSSVLSMWGSEYASLMVQLFSFLRLIQNLRLPSFFWTRTTVLAHGLCDFWIAPISSISQIWALTLLLYMCGVYISSALWRVSNLLPLFYAWSEQFCPGLGCCTQTGVPIWAAILWSASGPVWAILWGLGDPGPTRPIPFGIFHWIPQKSWWGGLPVAPGWQGHPSQPQPLWGFPWNGCLSCADR